MPLDNRSIAAADPGATLRDDQVIGLHLRVFAGRKSYYLYYRTKTGVERKPKIGDHGIITLTQAREIAREMLLVVAAGGDPVLDRTTAKQAPTMEYLCDRYMREYASNPKEKKPKSAAEDQRVIDKVLKPHMGKVRVIDVDYDLVAGLHQKLRKTPTQANRVLALVSVMLNLAERWKLRPLHSNPCSLITRYPENKRKRYMRPEEAPVVGRLLEAKREAMPESVAFIYLLLLTGARPDEIAKAQRKWVEKVKVNGIECGVLRLPDSKVGARPVYLPPQVMELLDKLPQSEDGTLTGIKSPKRLWDQVRKETGFKDLRIYDLRHTFASAGLSAGQNLTQIGMLLGHKQTQTTSRYTHLMEEAALSSVVATAGHVAKMMGKQESADGAGE